MTSSWFFLSTLLYLRFLTPCRWGLCSFGLLRSTCWCVGYRCFGTTILRILAVIRLLDPWGWDRKRVPNRRQVSTNIRYVTTQHSKNLHLLFPGLLSLIGRRNECFVGSRTCSWEIQHIRTVSIRHHPPWSNNIAFFFTRFFFYLLSFPLLRLSISELFKPISFFSSFVFWWMLVLYIWRWCKIADRNKTDTFTVISISGKTAAIFFRLYKFQS